MEKRSVIAEQKQNNKTCKNGISENLTNLFDLHLLLPFYVSPWIQCPPLSQKMWHMWASMQKGADIFQAIRINSGKCG